MTSTKHPNPTQFTQNRVNPFRVNIISHTHWDRAWYVTFQEFRARLVRLVDRLIEVLERDAEYRVFMLDGQMAVLEDYLEVRPQRKEKLVDLCKAGRLKVGPWYVLADEFLVHPESLIRNLQLGHRMGEEYGGVSKTGYVPDGFGHIAQLPQILRGFGIDNAFFWRGLGEEGERLGTEFVWKAPDGSDVTTIWMPFGYHNISNLGYPIHWGDTSQMEFDPELALDQIQSAIENLKPFAHTQTLLLMNGIDHEELEPRLPEIIALANEQLKPNQFIHANLEEHLKAVRNEATFAAPLPEYCGEFRWGKYAEILQGVYATRMHLKQANHRIETLYLHYAEPLAALSWLCGANMPEGTNDLLWTGWRWLLKNHPHDDIYGSGIDAVHAEMDYRFSQAEQIGEIIVRDSLRQLTREIDFSTQPGIPVVVFNPTGWDRKEIAIGNLDFEFDDPLAGKFQLVDADGSHIPHQVLDDQEVFWMETLKANRKRRIKLAFPIGVPAVGYQTLFVQPALLPENTQPVERNDWTQSSSNDVSRSEPCWTVHPNGAENAFLSFTINPDGSIDVKDQMTGAKFTNLAYFEDIEDCGDEYSFCPLPRSHPIRTLGREAPIRCLTKGQTFYEGQNLVHQNLVHQNLVTFEINHSLQLPESLSENRQQRSASLVDFKITTRVTLYRDQPGLFFETSLDNVAKDHKLSVVFPTNLEAKTVSVDQPFMVMERQINLPNSEGWVEDPSPLMHQRAFTDVSHGGTGLAIFNRGLPAVEVTEEEGKARVALVLLRCVGWLSRDDLWNRRIAAGPLVPTPGAQCPGEYRFEYAVFPHAGRWNTGHWSSSHLPSSHLPSSQQPLVIQAAYAYNAPLLVSRADTHEGLDLHEMNITRDDPSKVRTIPFPRGGKLPGMASFFRVNRAEIMLSSVHQPVDNAHNPQKTVVLRYVNMSANPVKAKLNSYFSIDEAWTINLNEELIKRLEVTDGSWIEFDCKAHEAVSLMLLFQKP